MPEQMNKQFTSLETLEISCCPKLESFPNGGLPPSLKKLLIQKCDSLTVLTDWGLNKMTLLTGLTIIGGCSKVESFPDVGLLPDSLTFIQISDFPVLQTLKLNGLQHLTLLKDLRINCSYLQRLSEGTLPSLILRVGALFCKMIVAPSFLNIKRMRKGNIGLPMSVGCGGEQCLYLCWNLISVCIYVGFRFELILQDVEVKFDMSNRMQAWRRTARSLGYFEGSEIGKGN
ncbi:hypothetical protein Dsin_010827 [Dipteronia sinensis]|uniref:Uncharacterized protein n=1 Tax=Dipteronia sinensis TaxID=43782 RepID=A0AAE0ATI9_9ROSI|nr:hypothetical protein Dsin_010827 [Dipteronia sinensis]